LPVAPVLAIEETLERMSGDSELLVNLFALYQTDAPKKLDTIGQLARAGDMQQLTRLAHSLKGASATVGASRMCQLAMDLEQAAKNGDGAGVDETFREIQTTCVDTLEQMRSFASSQPSA
jgi:HPt (histidine-containing phosphotransfer) domain-containing protein